MIFLPFDCRQCISERLDKVRREKIASVTWHNLTNSLYFAPGKLTEIVHFSMINKHRLLCF